MALILHEFTCPVCNKTFQHHDKRTVCCSWECSYIYRGQKMKGTLRGKIHNEEFKKRQSERYKGCGNPRYGKPYIASAKARLHISQALKGKKQSPQAIENARLARMGYKHSEATKLKISLSKRGDKHPCYGKHLSEETRDKISVANKGRKHTIETRLRMSNAKRNNYKPRLQLEIPCPICNTVFIPHCRDHKYCSPHCHHIAASRRFSGAGNPLYGIGHTEATKVKMRKNHYDSSGSKMVGG